jgi:ElaB/YqjD/DUF883 family membrane-anchored ribosome-binding protein
MSRLKLDSAPTFRTSVPTPASEHRAAPKRKAAPEAANPFKADVFEAKVKGSKGASSLPKTLEPLQGTLDELAKKVAADSTLDTKAKQRDAIEAELLKLKAEFNLSDRDFHAAFREVRKLADSYSKSDPEVGVSGGYREK